MARTGWMTIGSERVEDMRRRRSGVTLVELVVALGVATIALLAFFGALYSSSSLDRHTRERSVAMARAQTTLEDLLGRSWDDLGLQDGKTFPVPFEVQPGQVVQLPPAPGLAEPGAIEVKPWGTTGLRRVRVTVRWRSNGNGVGELHLETLIGQR
jgi:type II secretory pathway pseudopilin PulG